MKRMIIVLALLCCTFSAFAYKIGNSYATLVSCDWAYNPDYGTSGYTGTYKTTTGRIYKAPSERESSW